MNEPLTEALRILGHYWLEELQSADLETIQALPELAATLPQTGAAALTDLSVEYQRLFGFNLPPYESVFVDPSVMLMAPATERVQKLYQAAGWTPPGGLRAGAPDHLGLELLALADWLDRGQTDLARRLQSRHLALWGPVFLLTLPRLEPHPFYTALTDLTLDLLLATLPPNPLPGQTDPFPNLPPPPTYRNSDDWPPFGFEPGQEQPPSPPVEAEEKRPDLRRSLIKRLLTPREAGLFLTREDIGRLSQSLDLPGVVGERYRMLETLFRLADQYDLRPDLSRQLNQLLDKTNATYEAVAKAYAAWTPYARAWRRRLADSQTRIDEI